MGTQLRLLSSDINSWPTHCTGSNLGRWGDMLRPESISHRLSYWRVTQTTPYRLSSRAAVVAAAAANARTICTCVRLIFVLSVRNLPSSLSFDTNTCVILFLVFRCTYYPRGTTSTSCIALAAKLPAVRNISAQAAMANAAPTVESPPPLCHHPPRPTYHLTHLFWVVRDVPQILVDTLR